MFIKSKLTAYLLLFFLGLLGAHRFYLGKVGTGLIYLFTFGLLGFGWIYDLFTLGRQVDIYNLIYGGEGRLRNTNENNVIVNVPSPDSGGVVHSTDKAILQTPEKQETREQTNAEKLIELAELKDKGVLTQREFEREKDKILRPPNIFRSFGR